MFRVGLVLTFALGISGQVWADSSTTINPQTTWGVWEGWGVSLCWWAKVFGTRDDLADLVFTTNNRVFLNLEVLPGLGMNIARYNAGACTSNSINGQSMQVSANIQPSRQMPGFWLDWFSSNPDTPSWLWTADANQRAMLLKAKARGANLLELFSNSPMWWMSYNHNPSGADSGANDNLQSWNYQQHAVYLATIAKYAQDHWGVTFNFVEPFNEPIATWWRSNGTQEGCHFNTGTQASVLGYLRSELNARGLTAVGIAASDESYYDQATSTWNSFNSTTRAQVSKVNVHGYQYSGGRRDLLYSAVVGKRLWNSEYGESDGSGLSLARNLNLDFHWLHPTAWCYWQPLDGGGWGLVQANVGANSIGSSNTKYFVLAQYTRHIRPGMTIMDGGSSNTIAAYDGPARKLVLVTLNSSAPQSVTYNLSAFFGVGGPIHRWVTSTDGSQRYFQYPDITLTNKSFQSFFATNSIQTFELENVDVTAPPLVKLTIQPGPSQGQVTLSWPTWAANYRVYTTPTLIPPRLWQTLTNAPATNNGAVYINLPMATGAQQFFRLGYP